MNPSFMCLAKIKPLALMDIIMGKHVPKAKGTQETSINGRAFAPGHGVQQAVSSEEKEAIVRAHLNKLASEAKARSKEMFPDADDATITENTPHARVIPVSEAVFPSSDMVTEANEHYAQSKSATVRQIAKERGIPVVEVKMSQGRADADYIYEQQRIDKTTEANIAEACDKISRKAEIFYKTSVKLDKGLTYDEQREVHRRNAAIHTGDANGY